MRKLALLTTMVIAVLAMTAASATAATQVRNSSGVLCSQVSPAINASNALANQTSRNYTSGGCTVRMAGTYRIYRSTSSPEYTDCNVAFDAHIGGDGWGYADNYVYSNCSLSAPNACPGDRLIAPPSYASTPQGSFLFSPYKDAATDLLTEQCANFVATYQWSYASMDITTLTGGQWRWTDQYNLADPRNTSGIHQHRAGLLTSAPGTALTITH